MTQYDLYKTAGPEVGQPETVCYHCGAYLYGPDPELERCPVCADTICRRCEKMRCESCNTPVHRGCTYKLDALKFCSEKCRDEVVELGLCMSCGGEGVLPVFPGMYEPCISCMGVREV